MSRNLTIGKTNTTVTTVGKSKAYDYQTIQAAVNAIETAGDHASTKPYTIKIGNGVYDETVSVKNITDIAFEGEGAATVISPSSGQAMIIGDGSTDADSAERISIRNMRITSPDSSAIDIGTSAHPTTFLPADDILIEGCIVEAEDSAIRIYGASTDYTSAAGRYRILNNVIRAGQFGIEWRARMCLTSQGNWIEVNSKEILPYVTSVSTAGERCAFFRDLDEGLGGTTDYYQDDDLFESIGDRMHVFMDSAGAGMGLQTDILAAYGFKQGTDGASPGAPRVSIVSPQATVINEYDHNRVDYMGGIVFKSTSTTPAIPEDWFIVQGGHFYVDQRVNSSNLNIDPAGVHLETVAFGSCFVKISGTIIKVIQAYGSNTPYSLQTIAGNDTIEGVIYSDEATNAPAGTISALGSKP